MARDKKLKAALDRHKGVDHKLERQKKLQKEAKKRKRNRSSKISELKEDEYVVSGTLAPLEEEKEPVFECKENGEKPTQNEAAADEENLWDTDEEDEDEDEGLEVNISNLDESESSDEEDEEQTTTIAKVQNGTHVAPGEIASETSAAEDEEDIPFSDIASIASEEKGDIVTHQRLTINNTTALLAAHKRIALPLSKLPFSAHQSITSSDPTLVRDINDDLNRELAFYKQSLSAVQEARRLLKAEDIPFSRPTDYFAEMVKSDEHMGRVRQKLVDVAASKKAAAEARKQRDLKKFGKQVQVEKRQERERAKKETLERIQILKRKRANAPLENENEPDMFDVELENADDSHKSKRRRPDGGPPDSRQNKPNAKRQAKNARYGFGGKKRHSKSGDAISSSDMKGFSTARMKGKTGGGKGAKQRPGKSRRAKGRL